MLKSTKSNEVETTRKVKLEHGGEIMDIEEECIEKVMYIAILLRW